MADLKSFVQTQLAQKQASQKADSIKRKQKWLAELESLFDFVRKALLHAGFPSEHIVLSTHSLQEETLGMYDAPGLVLILPAGGRITFTPISSVIIGGYGRVDVTGPARDRVKLIADDATEDRSDSDETPSYERQWSWQVHPELGHRGAFRFNEQGLAQLLAIVTGSE